MLAKFWQPIRSTIAPFVPNVVTAAAILGGYLGINQLVDFRIEGKLKNSSIREDVIKELSKRIVFDGLGHVTFDPHGVFNEWIEKIEVQEKVEPPYAPMPYGAITIKFKRLVVMQPILRHQSGGNVIGKRTGNLEWKFEASLFVVGVQSSFASPDDKYILDIID